MRRRGGTVAALALVAALAAGCEGGDATPTDIGPGEMTGPSPADDPGQRDPGDDLDEATPGELAPTEQPGIETPEDATPTPGS